MREPESCVNGDPSDGRYKENSFVFDAEILRKLNWPKIVQKPQSVGPGVKTKEFLGLFLAAFLINV